MSFCCFCVDVQNLICYTVLWNRLKLVHCISKMTPTKHQINLYYTHQSCTLSTSGDLTPVLQQTRMVKPLHKRAAKGMRNRTGTSKKCTKEEMNVTNLNKFNFPYYSCKRIAKPYPDGLVDQRDSFRLQLWDSFILDIANFHRRLLNACPFSLCGVKLIPYFGLKYESYIGYTVPSVILFLYSSGTSTHAPMRFQ